MLFVLGTWDCYIYDPTFTSYPYGGDYIAVGKKTFLEAKSSINYFSYGPNRTVATSSVQQFLDSTGWVRHIDGVLPASADLSEVTHYAFDSYYEDECVEKCAGIASCIAASVYNGRCYIYDSSATSEPEGASLFVEGASDVGHVLGQNGEVYGAVTFTPELAIEDAFMDDWVKYDEMRLYGGSGVLLTYYRVTDISEEHCRRYCAASEHCLGYSMYTSGLISYISHG